MPWVVEFHGDFEPEFSGLEPGVQEALLAVAKLLADYGPQLGRMPTRSGAGSTRT